MAKATYYILSGEGEDGQWSGPFVTTERGAKMRQARERAGGDRFASLWELIPLTATHREHVREVGGGLARETPGNRARAV
jgi:hypothetical protein